MKKLNKRAKGQRALKKTKDYFEKQGYYCEKLEVLKMGWVGGKTIPIRIDILAADLCLIKKDEFILCQVKSHFNDLRMAKLNFAKIPFPNFIKRICVIWPPRTKTPEVYPVENSEF